MWPFKAPIKIEATCSSGVLECDGKHHVWSRWARTDTPYALLNTKTGAWINGKKVIQERSCIICGYIEQKALHDD